jgi:hypothetical protein
VHRPLEEQREDGRSNVGPAASAAAARATPGTTRAAERAAGAEVGAAAEREALAEAESATAHAVTVVHVMTLVDVPHDYLRSVVDT